MGNVTQNICDILIETGIEQVFGMPGGGITEIWHGVSNHPGKINTSLVRHEQAGACMADMYGRLTGKPAVLLGQGPFISTTGSFGILEAFLSYSPMLVITDTSDADTFSQHGVYQCGTGEYGGYDQVAKLRTASKYITYAVTPEEAIQGVQLGIKHAISVPFGPSCVVMRTTAACGDVNPKRIPKIYKTKHYLHENLSIPLKSETEEVAEILVNADFPVAIAGNGVHASKSYQELQKLAEILGMPVVTTMKGKGAFPEIHPLAGGTMGTFGQKIANNVISEADVLLVLGSRLSPNDTNYESMGLINPTTQKIIQIDIDARNAGWTYPIEKSLIGHLKFVLIELLSAVLARQPKTIRQRTERFNEKKGNGTYFYAEETQSEDRPILPQRIVREISRVATPDTIITVDAGSNKHWMNHFFQTKEAGTYYGPGGIGGMGWSVPAAVGAKIARPSRPVISVAGDGGFMMMIHTLSTAVQYQLPIVFIVMNDSNLTMIQDFVPEEGVANLQFTLTDYAKIASSMGCNGVKIEDPTDIAPSLEQAMNSGQPTVIDIVTSSKESISKIITGRWGTPND